MTRKLDPATLTGKATDRQIDLLEALIVQFDAYRRTAGCGADGRATFAPSAAAERMIAGIKAADDGKRKASVMIGKLLDAGAVKPAAKARKTARRPAARKTRRPARTRRPSSQDFEDMGHGPHYTRRRSTGSARLDRVAAESAAEAAAALRRNAASMR